MRGLLFLLVTLWSSLFAVVADAQSLLIHRLGPSEATLYIAAADGSNERPLLASSAFDYNPSLSADGEWVVFTSERDGSADIYRVRSDGSSLERLTNNPAYDDQASLSPDGTQVAFVTTRGTATTDIWVLDLETRSLRNITSEAGGDFRPSWSPDGQWIAFSSDRGTSVEQELPVWEQLHRTSIYLVRPDGSETRRLTSGERSAGSPKWFGNGRRVMFYEIEVADTFHARLGQQPQNVISSQIVSIDHEGGARQEHTNGPGLKASPQPLDGTQAGYLLKGGSDIGIMYTSGSRATPGQIRNPSWSSDGARLVFERAAVESRNRGVPDLQRHFSASKQWELRQMAFMPSS